MVFAWAQKLPPQLPAASQFIAGGNLGPSAPGFAHLLTQHLTQLSPAVSSPPPPSIAIGPGSKTIGDWAPSTIDTTLASYLRDQITEAQWQRLHPLIVSSAEVICDHLTASQSASRAMIARREAGVTAETTISSNGRHSSSIARGVPRKARLVFIDDGGLPEAFDPRDTALLSATTLFRHYVRDEEALQAIVRSGEIIAGPRPFYPVGGHDAMRHVDLVGAFFATAEFTPDLLGVTGSKQFIDFLLHPGSAMVSLHETDHRYLLVPGEPKQPQWIENAFAVWREAGRPDRQQTIERMRELNYQSPWTSMVNLVEWFSEIDENGGFPSPARIPIIPVQ